MDYKIHTHATYATCDAVDAFEAAPAYRVHMTADKEALYWGISTFFRDALGVGGGRSVNGSSSPRHARWARCSAPPLQVRSVLDGQQAIRDRTWTAAS